MIDISISGARPKEVSQTIIGEALGAAFRGARLKPHGSVSVAFVSETAMRALNRKWRKKNKSTDVLSFAPPVIPGVSSQHRDWGDIVVSPVYVRAESKKRKILFREELLRVTIHGMLHLLGYDHATVAEEKEMFGIQERALTRILHSV